MTITASEHERKPRCYIAGPIAGVPDFWERFADAVPVVEELGYEPVNPCDITPAVHDMRADLRALLDCDAIYMLPGWRESRGATAEHAVAVACGMRIYTEADQ